MKESQDTLKIQNLDHLGIVAGVIDEIELVEEVDKIVGVTSDESDDFEWIGIFERPFISI
jgi:Domain of unknown function (DUF4277)